MMFASQHTGCPQHAGRDVRDIVAAVVVDVGEGEDGSAGDEEEAEIKGRDEDGEEEEEDEYYDLFNWR